jgi:hypothetical protein
VSGYDTIEGLNYKNIFTGPMETFKAAFKALQLCLPGSSEPFAWDRSAPNPEYTYTEHWWEEGGTVFFGECGAVHCVTLYDSTPRPALHTPPSAQVSRWRAAAPQT